MKERTSATLFQLSYAMSEMAASYPNHEIANALADVADKLTKFGDDFDPKKLTKLDKHVIMFYHQHKDNARGSSSNPKAKK